MIVVHGKHQNLELEDNPDCIKHIFRTEDIGTRNSIGDAEFIVIIDYNAKKPPGTKEAI